MKKFNFIHQLFYILHCISGSNIWFLAIMFNFLLSCSMFEPGLPSEEDLLDGPIEGLTFSESKLFLLGDIAFNDEVFTVASGLGPLFVATSCGSCHAGDGKGHPFTTLTRFGQIDLAGNQYLRQGGPQLQHRSIPGFEPEVIPHGATSTKLTPPANTGLGYIELVSDQDIMLRSDPLDSNQDGISGVPNWNTVPDYVKIPEGAINQNGKYICRFGKKGATYDLLQQTVNAYNQDMGITTSFESIDTYTGLSQDPEVDDKTIRNVVVYLQTLKAPIPRSPNDPEIIIGKKLFNEVGCESCHRETLHTRSSKIASLSNKTFHPYTDLLLHDMGQGLDDGYTEGSATTAEWRTPPLWGLGLARASQGGQYYLLHDGRAHSITEAIEMHGGESTKSVLWYKALSSSDKSKLIRFLESL